MRDRFVKLEKEFKRKVAEENRASGVAPEHTELDQALEDILERSEAAQEEVARGDERKEKNAEKERETAESVRKRPMERLAETRGRESPKSAKKKRKGSIDQDAVEYLREKNEKELKIKMDEIELRKREIDIQEKEKEREWEMRKRELEAREKRDQELMALLQQQVRQQQAMQQQLLQQNQLLLDVLKKFMDKIV